MKYKQLLLIGALLGALTLQAQRNYQINGGNAYTAMLTSEGEVFTWGYNNYGQLGRYIGSNYTSIPGKVEGLDRPIRAVDAGSGSHTLALAQDSTVWAWGQGDDGQLGNGIASIDYAFGEYYQIDPQPIFAGATNMANPFDTLRGIKHISAGTSASYAITQDNRLIAWGSNLVNGHEAGQLGTNGQGWYFNQNGTVNSIGAVNESSLPMYVINADGDPLEHLIAVEASDYHCYALVDDDNDGDPTTGRVYAWGTDFSSQHVIAADGYPDQSSVARLVVDDELIPLSGIHQITAGDANGFFVKKKTGEVYSVGADELGQRGLGIPNLKPAYAAKVLSGSFESLTGNKYLSNVISISAGQSHCIAVVSVHGVNYTVSWGGNKAYYIANSSDHYTGVLTQSNLIEDFNPSPDFVRFANGDTLKNIISVSAGDGNSIAIQDDNTGGSRILIWGNDTYGQCGQYKGDFAAGTTIEYNSYYFDEPQEFAIPPYELAVPCPKAHIQSDTVYLCPMAQFNEDSVTFRAEYQNSGYNYSWVRKDPSTGAEQEVSTSPLLSTVLAGTYVLTVTSKTSNTLYTCSPATDSVVVLYRTPPFTQETKTIAETGGTITLSGTDGDIFELYGSPLAAAPLATDTVTNTEATFAVSPTDLQPVSTDLYGNAYPAENTMVRGYVADKSEYPFSVLDDLEFGNHSIGGINIPAISQNIKVKTHKTVLQSVDLIIDDRSPQANTITVCPLIFGETMNSNGAPIADRNDTLYKGEMITFTKTYSQTLDTITIPINVELPGFEDQSVSYWFGIEFVSSYSLNIRTVDFESEEFPISNSEFPSISIAGLSEMINSSYPSANGYTLDIRSPFFNYQFTAYNEFPCGLAPIDLQVAPDPIPATPSFADTEVFVCESQAAKLKPASFLLPAGKALNHNMYYFKGAITADSLKTAGLSGAVKSFQNITDIDDLPVLSVPYDSADTYTLVTVDGDYPNLSDAWRFASIAVKQRLRVQYTADIPREAAFCPGGDDTLRLSFGGTSPFQVEYQLGEETTETTAISHELAIPVPSQFGEFPFAVLNVNDAFCPALADQHQTIQSSTGADSAIFDTVKSLITVYERPAVIKPAQPVLQAGTAQPITLADYCSAASAEVAEYQLLDSQNNGTVLPDGMWDISDRSLVAGTYRFAYSLVYAPKTGCSVNDTFALQLHDADHFIAEIVAVTDERQPIAQTYAITADSVYEQGATETIVIGGLDPGTLAYTLSAPGYYPKDTSLTIVDANISDTIVLMARSYSLGITVRHGVDYIEGATVTVAGAEYTTSSNGTVTITGLGFGTYPITVSAVGYEVATTSMIMAGENPAIEITIPLEIAQPRIYSAIADTACGQYDFNGTILTQSGIYKDTVKTAADIDSIITLTLTVGKEYSQLTQVSIVTGDSYLFHGAEYDQAGIYADTLTSVLGCDSILVLDLAVVDKMVTVKNIEASGCDSVVFNGSTFYQSIAFIDSIITGTSITVEHIQIDVWQSYADTIEKTVPYGAEVYFNGQAISESKMVTNIMQTEHGCDSIEILSVTILPKRAIETDTAIAACGQAVFADSAYTTSGDYTYRFEAELIDSVFQTRELLDSVFTVSATVWPEYTVTETASLLYGQTLPFGDTVLATSGTYTQLLTTNNGCDSVVTMELAVAEKKTVTNEVELTTCYLFTYGNIPVTGTGTYYDTLAIAGGDSIVILNYTYNPTILPQNEVMLKAGDEYVFGEKTLTEAGIYTDTIVTDGFCDQIASVKITVKPEAVIVDSSAIACQSFTFAGNEYTESGTYYDTLVSAISADTIIQLDLTIGTSFRKENTETISVGEYVVLWGDTVGTATQIEKTYITSAGCDSTIAYTIVVAEPATDDTLVIRAGNTELTITLPENTENGTMIGLLPFTDTAGNVLQYSVIEPEGFTVSGNTLTVSNGSVLDYEQQSSIPVKIAVTNNGSTDTVTVTVAIENINDHAPAFATAPAEYELANGAQDGTVIADFAGSDADGSALYFAILSSQAIGQNGSATDAPGVFAVDSLTGALSLQNASLVNRNETARYEVSILLSDGELTDTAYIAIVLKPEETGIYESAWEISVMPTVAQTGISITAPVNGTLAITSVTGSEVVESRSFSNSQTVDVSSLATGMYFVKIVAGKTVSQAVFFKE